MTAITAGKYGSLLKHQTKKNPFKKKKKKRKIHKNSDAAGRRQVCLPKAQVTG